MTKILAVLGIFGAISTFALGLAAVLPEEQTFVDCKTCPVMVKIPAGQFNMGAAADEPYGLCTLRPSEACRERPQVTVHIYRPFAVGKFEVTRGQFLEYAKQVGRETDFSPCESIDWKRMRDGDGLVYTSANPQYPVNWEMVTYGPEHYTDRHPVVCVSWWDAKRYADWLSGKTGKSYRLLTEAEWEYVARSGSELSSPWGRSYDSASKFANVLDASWMHQFPKTGTKRNRELPTLLPRPDFDGADDGHVYSAPVGSFEKNAFKVHDMIGNVWEWVEDCWHETYVGFPRVNDGGAWKADCRPVGSEMVVHRGGSFADDRSESRFAERAQRLPTTAADHIGFRVARELP